jgi:hypothetical protein
MYQPARVIRSTPALDKVAQGNKQVDASSISLVPEDDTLSRKLNSLIRSMSTPGTPPTPHDGFFSNKPPIKPLIPRRTSRVTRHKRESQRFSPLEGLRRGSPSKKPLTRRPRDTKVLYKVSSSRTLCASPPKHAPPEKPALLQSTYPLSTVSLLSLQITS